MDGMIEDAAMLSRIASDIKPYVRSSLDKAAESILRTLKILCVRDPILPTADRIHLSNGTYFLKEGFSPDREWTMNRLPVAYDPNATEPVRWKRFLSELLYEEDIITLQEFLGYTLIASNKGQAMLLLIGQGGEGKSRIGAVLQKMFGNNLNIGDIYKLEHDKFAPQIRKESCFLWMMT
mgnify:CR=1 FL=1